MVNEFNTTLKNLRKDKGITQEQLAESVGVSPQAVSKWEMNSYPDASLLPAIAEFLGISIDELFGNQKENVEMEKRIVDYVRETPEEEMYEKIMKIGRAIICGMMGMNDFYALDVWGDEDDIPFNKAYSPPFSQFENDNGFLQIRWGKRLNYLYVMPEFEGGYDDLLRYDESYLRLYRFLSIPNAIRAMYFFTGRKRNAYFTVDSVVTALGIEKKNAEEIVKEMKELSFVDEATLDTGKGDEFIFHYKAGINFISFMAFSYNLLNMPQNFHCQSNRRNDDNPYFKHNTYGKDDLSDK